MTVDILAPDTLTAAPRLYTFATLARATTLSQRTLWQEVREGRLRATRIRRAVRFDPADVSAWIERRKSDAK